MSAHTRLGLATTLLATLALLFGSFAAGMPAVVAAESERVAVLIAFDAQPGAAQEALVRAHGGTIKYRYHLVPAIAAMVPAASIAALERSGGVLRVEADGIVFAIDHDANSGDAELENTWGVEHIRAGEAHSSGNVGTAVKVAVIDSGVDYTHPDLAANYAGGRDFVNGDDDPMDDNSHGTHVAGTVAAVKGNGGVVGVAPSAAIFALKVLNASGSGSWSDIIAALQWTVDNGIQVTNNSYGSGTNPGSTVQAAFDNSYGAGVLHVAAAGNSGNCGGNNNSVG
ncbi:MAG: S8 family serine peptidase, partial [Candidatus Limnocylindria bacterium]